MLSGSSNPLQMKATILTVPDLLEHWKMSVCFVEDVDFRILISDYSLQHTRKQMYCFWWVFSAVHLPRLKNKLTKLVANSFRVATVENVVSTLFACWIDLISFLLPGFKGVHNLFLAALCVDRNNTKRSSFNMFCFVRKTRHFLWWLPDILFALHIIVPFPCWWWCHGFKRS